MFPFCGCLVSDISVFILSPMVRSEIWGGAGLCAACGAARSGEGASLHATLPTCSWGRHLPVDFSLAGDVFSRQEGPPRTIGRTRLLMETPRCELHPKVSLKLR